MENSSQHDPVPRAQSLLPTVWHRAAAGTAVVAVVAAITTWALLRSPTKPTEASAVEPGTTVAETSIPETTPESTSTTPPPDAPKICTPPPEGTGPAGPLTGRPVERPGYENRPALVVKIDNLDYAARPQGGLSRADVVYEERVEGLITRFAAVFHGNDATYVGPIRSGRSTDVAIVGPLNYPLFAFSGANGAFLDLLRSSRLVDIGADARPGAYYRSGGQAPHNLFSSTNVLYNQGKSGPPPPLWPFRGEDEPPPAGGRRAYGASFNFGGGNTAVLYTWDAAKKGWARTQNGSPHIDTDYCQVTPQNVIIQLVDYVDSGVPDGYGNPIPEARQIGEGNGWVLTGGYAIPVRWRKSRIEEPTQFLGPDDQPVALAPGRTWVELVPTQSGATIYYG
ncbi:MAG: DUF3048 domain-containing protein [Acidimicrobiales bacterium]|nr:DUF3048 domain-containing protein [Acidimicrobiales bacterium]